MAIDPNSRNATRWTIRIIPFFIFGAFGFAIYTVVAHLCGTSLFAPSCDTLRMQISYRFLFP